MDMHAEEQNKMLASSNLSHSQMKIGDLYRQEHSKTSIRKTSSLHDDSMYIVDRERTASKFYELAHHENQDTVDLAKQIRFDHRLKEKIAIRHDDRSMGFYKFHKQYLCKVKNVLLLLYFFVVPFFQTPPWCRKHYE